MVISTDFEAQRSIDEEIKSCKDIETLRRLYRRRNTCAAINKLPTELLVQIFASACDIHTLKKGDELMSTRFMIMCVCTMWRAIAVATPQLWTFVSLREPQWVRPSLKRTQTMPLIVEYAKAHHTLDRSLVDSLKQESFRFKEVRVDWPRNDASDLIVHFFNDPTFHVPLLRTLVIDMDIDTSLDHGHLGGGRTTKPAILEAFWTGLTALRFMKLSNALPSHTTYLPHLTHLTIDVTSEGNCLSLPWLVEFLQNTPMMEDLDIGTISSDHPVTLPPFPISLPNLRSLYLELQSLNESELFLYIELPSSPPPIVEVYFVNGSMDSGSNSQDDHVSACLQHLISHATQFAQDPESLSSPLLEVAVDTGIGLGYQLTVTVAGNDSYEFFVFIPRLPSQLRGQTIPFTSALPLERICEVSLRGRVHRNEVIAWCNLLPRLVELRYIRVERVNILRRLAGSGPFSRAAERRVTSADFNNRKIEEICVDGDKWSTPRDWSTFIRISKIRAKHGNPFETVQIRDCNVLEDQVRELEPFTDVDWDEDEV